MRILNLTAKFCLVFAAVLFVQGCGTRRPAAPTSAAPNTDDRVAPGNVAQLSDVVAAWEAGEKDRAAKLLLSVDWNDPDVTSRIAVLSMSEEQFEPLAESEQNRVIEEFGEFSRASKALASHAISLGEEAMASGDAQGAKDYYEAVRNLGQALSKPDKLLVLQLLGKSIVTMANEKLASLE